MNNVLLVVGHDPATELGPALALGARTGRIVRYFVPDEALPRPVLPSDVRAIVALPTIQPTALVWAQQEAQDHAISIIRPQPPHFAGTTYGADPSVWGAWVWTGQRWTWWELSIHDEPPEGTPPPGPLHALLALGVTLGSVALLTSFEGLVRR
jgi:hypothetical protein